MGKKYDYNYVLKNKTPLCMAYYIGGWMGWVEDVLHDTTSFSFSLTASLAQNRLFQEHVLP